MEFLYQTIKTVVSDEVSELDFILRDEVTPEFDYEKYDLVETHLGNRTSDGYPVKIDSLIEKLNDFKALGCNYVSIEHHCDHIGYMFDGMHIYRSTPEEIKTLLDQNKTKDQLLAELLEVENKYKEAKRDYNEAMNKLNRLKL
jgi:hypothetical protein